MFDYDNGLQERIRKDVDCVNKYLTKLSDAEQEIKKFFKDICKTIEYFKRYGKLPKQVVIKKEKQSLINIKQEDQSPKRSKLAAVEETEKFNNEDQQLQILQKTFTNENIKQEFQNDSSLKQTKPLGLPVKTERTRNTRSFNKINNANAAADKKLSENDSDVVYLNNATTSVVIVSSDDEQSNMTVKNSPDSKFSKCKSPRFTQKNVTAAKTSRSAFEDRENKSSQSDSSDTEKDEKIKTSLKNLPEKRPNKFSCSNISNTKTDKIKNGKSTLNNTEENTEKDKLYYENTDSILNADYTQVFQKSRQSSSSKCDNLKNAHEERMTHNRKNSSDKKSYETKIQSLLNKIKVEEQSDEAEYKDAIDNNKINDATVAIVENVDETYIQDSQKTRECFTLNDVHLKDIIHGDSPLSSMNKKSTLPSNVKINAEAKKILSKSGYVNNNAETFEKVKENQNEQLEKPPAPVNKTKSKCCTPSKTMITKQNSEKNSDGPKPLSSVKASKAAFRERELRRQKEEEQRQAQLQAQMAEKRRKQEEKHRNARQAREQREKEKLKLFEMAKPMREEKSNKLAESGQKCLLSKKKALKDISNKKQQKKLPVYMTNKAPLLPTDDCYDSDDQKKNFVQQEWRKSGELIKTQRIMVALGEPIKNSFFCRKAQTIDLAEIFEDIEPRELKRNSSAIWDAPPRYTQVLPVGLDVSEESDGSSDVDD